MGSSAHSPGRTPSRRQTGWGWFDRWGVGWDRTDLFDDGWTWHLLFPAGHRAPIKSHMKIFGWTTQLGLALALITSTLNAQQSDSDPPDKATPLAEQPT